MGGTKRPSFGSAPGFASGEQAGRWHKADSIRTEAARPRQKTECLAFQCGILIGRLAPTQHSAMTGNEGATLFCGRGGVVGRANLVNWTSICHSFAILPTEERTHGTHGTHGFPDFRAAQACHFPRTHGPQNCIPLLSPLAHLPAPPSSAAAALSDIRSSPSQQSARTEPLRQPSAVSVHAPPRTRIQRPPTEPQLSAS